MKGEAVGVEKRGVSWRFRFPPTLAQKKPYLILAFGSIFSEADSKMALFVSKAYWSLRCSWPRYADPGIVFMIWTLMGIPVPLMGIPVPTSTTSLHTKEFIFEHCYRAEDIKCSSKCLLGSSKPSLLFVTDRFMTRFRI
jgi:hypothetical protein